MTEGFPGGKCHFWDSQKKGLLCCIEEGGGPDEHVNRALRRSFPLFQKPSLPTDVVEALSWVSSRSSTEVLNFWQEQLHKMRSVKIDGGGGIDIDMIRFCTREVGLSGELWVGQLKYGFRLVGEMGRGGVFPEQEVPECIFLEEIYSTAEARWVDLGKNNA